MLTGLENVSLKVKTAVEFDDQIPVHVHIYIKRFKGLYEIKILHAWWLACG